MSLFDPNLIGQTTFDEAGETDYTPIPPGEYVGAVGSYKLRANQDGSVVLDVLWELQDNEEGALAAAGITSKAIAKQGVFLDMITPTQIDGSKKANIPLNRLRVATGTDGKGFQFSMLKGKVARCKVEQKSRVVDGEVVPVSNVVAVSPL